MKVLLSAYACQPGQGSEPAVGWNVVQEVVKYHQVWVLTRLNNRPKIEAYLQQTPIPNLQFIYLDWFGWSNRWKPGEIGKGLRIHYYLWQIRAYLVARKLHQEIGFDLVHHLTYVQYSTPCFLTWLSLPLLWGPVGGGESAPASFWPTFSQKAKTYEWLRDVSRWVGEIDPFVRMTARQSLLTLATTQDTANRLQKIGAKRVEVYGQCALSESEIKTWASLPAPPTQPIRFISIGRLLHWKGFYLGVEAFALARPPESEYWIVGDGPEREALAAQVERLGIGASIKMLGKLSGPDLLAAMGNCHVLVHPSLHDSGGFVCIEAMAAARPVLCLDLGGPGMMVTEATGFKVPALDPQQTVKALAAAMTLLVQDPELRQRMGMAGQSRVREVYDWKVKGQFFAQVYEELVQTGTEKH